MRTVYLLLLTIIPFISVGQTLSCDQDSLAHNQLYQIFYAENGTFTNKNKGIHLNKFTLDQIEIKDRLCGILLYAKIFDHFFYNDIDPKKIESYLEDYELFSVNFLSNSNDSIALERRNNIGNKINNVQEFRRCQDNYTLKFIYYRYTNDEIKKGILEKEISEVMKYGLFSYPESVRDVLLFKYETTNLQCRE